MSAVAVAAAPAAERRRGHRSVEMGWGLGAQALSSASNLVVAALAARLLSASGFGGFSLATATYFVVLGLARAAIGEQRSMDGRTGRDGDAAALGAAVLVGAAIAVVVLVGALFTTDAARAPLLVVGLGLPVLLLQDAYRFVFLARGTARGAFLVDLAWLVVVAGCAVGAIALGRPGVGLLTALWVAGAAAGCVLGVLLGGVVPGLGAGWRWIVERRHRALRLAAESVAVMGSWQLTLAVVAAVDGLVAAGSLRAVQVVFGPLHVAIVGMGLVVVPDGVRASEGGVPRVVVARQRARWAATALGGAATAGLAVLCLLPDAWGQVVLGDSWAGARHVLVPFGLFMVTQAVVAALAAGHRIALATRESLGAAAVSSALVLACGSVGAVLGGPVATAWALAGAGVVGIAVWTASLFRLPVR